jgi:hypothetical protein
MFTLTVMHNGAAPEEFHAKRQPDGSYALARDNELVAFARQQRLELARIKEMLDDAEREVKEAWQKVGELHHLLVTKREHRAGYLASGPVEQRDPP